MDGLEWRLEQVESELGIDAQENRIRRMATMLSDSQSYFTVENVDGSIAYIGLDGDITPEVIRQVEDYFDWWEFHQDKGQFVVGENNV